MKVVINASHHGFSLTKKALEYLGISDDPNGSCLPIIQAESDRSNPRLIQCIEELGKKATHDDVEIVEIPDGIDYKIIEYRDGFEMVAEEGHYWR